MTQLNTALITANFTVIQGSDNTCVVTVSKQDEFGAVTPLGPISDARYAIYDGDTQLLSLPLGMGILYSAPSFTVTLNKTQTAALPAGKLSHELVFVDNTGVTTHCLVGSVLVKKTNLRM